MGPNWVKLCACVKLDNGKPREGVEIKGLDERGR